VLVLYGSRDAAAVAGSRTLLAQIPQAVNRRLPDLGHDPFFEGLPSASEAIHAFLAPDSR
jgi:hypothetical protein